MDRNLVIGQLLGLLTAACWAQNSIIYRYLGAKVGSDAVAHVRMWLALPAILLLAYLTEGSFFPTSLSAQTYLVLFASGVIGYFITDMLLFYAYVWLGPRESMIIMTLSPVVTALFSYFLFAERLKASQIVGILLTILGVVFMVVGGMRAKKNTTEERQRTKGMAFAILGSILQSLSFLLAKYALDSTGPVSTNLLRNVGGLMAFIIYSFIIKRNARSQFAAFRNPKLLLLLFLAAMVGPVLGMSSQMKAFTLAPVGIVTTITQTTPILLLPIDKFILKKKISTSSLLATFVSILGIAILFLAA
ncbi:DMT family transporter [Sphaerochaeta sp. PS]|uniref:DMT family transporter n=1 Tax=Sphaerochaeta sp. PS TaxID=3076336 RepID=UPI0028A550C8|nr:DMT family transporter [Sphaerochaeta sp. PS]MDT4762113.1 DMT family transporter [Sphaerochaeta sp. PS]